MAPPRVNPPSAIPATANPVAANPVAASLAAGNLTAPGAVTKVPRLVELLRARLGAGEWGPGDRLPTFSELQNQFEVTPNTISKALTTLETEGLIVRSQGKGIFVAPRSERPRLHAIGIRGVDYREFQSPYWTDLMGGIHAEAQAHELEVTLLHEKTTRGFARVDGIVLHGGKARREDIPSVIPTVVMLEPIKGHPAVASNDFGGMRDAVEHLVALGHRKIGYLAYVASPLIQTRLAGYWAALRTAGIVANPQWVHDLSRSETQGQGTWEAGHTVMKMWLADTSDAGWDSLGCTALLCQNDEIASSCLAAFATAGRRVPQDVSVVGFDGTSRAERTMPPLTTVRLPLHELGATATRLLMRRIDGEDVGLATITLPTELVIRGSTAPPPP